MVDLLGLWRGHKRELRVYICVFLKDSLNVKWRQPSWPCFCRNWSENDSWPSRNCTVHTDDCYRILSNNKAVFSLRPLNTGCYERIYFNKCKRLLFGTGVLQNWPHLSVWWVDWTHRKMHGHSCMCTLSYAHFPLLLLLFFLSECQKALIVRSWAGAQGQFQVLLCLNKDVKKTWQCI